MPPPAYRIAHKTPRSSMSTPHIFFEPRGPPSFGPAIRYPLSALAARRRPRSRRYSPPTYCAIARSPPWARGYHNHRSPVPALGTSNGTVDACMIQSKMLRCISLGSGRAVRRRPLPPRGRPASETMYSTATTYSHTCMANNTAVDLQYSASIMITGRSQYNRYFVSQQQKP